MKYVRNIHYKYNKVRLHRTYLSRASQYQIDIMF